MTLRQSMRALMVALIVIVFGPPAFPFSATGTEHVTIVASEIAREWQPMRANRSNSIWTAYRQSAPHSRWELFLEEFVEYNRNLFPSRLQTVRDFYLRENEVYLVPVQKVGNSPLELTVEQQRLFTLLRASVESQVMEQLRQSGLDPVTLAQQRQQIATALQQTDAEAAIESVLVDTNVTEIARAAAVRVVEAEFATFSELMVADVEAIWSSINELERTVAVLTDEMSERVVLTDLEAILTQRDNERTVLDERVSVVEEQLTVTGTNPFVRQTDLISLRNEIIPLTRSSWGLLILLGAIGVACVALFVVVLLWQRKPWQKEIATVLTVVNERYESVGVAQRNADTAMSVTLDAVTTRYDELTKQVKAVSKLQVLQLELDASERFSCSDLTDERLKLLREGEDLTLTVTGLDNKEHKIRVQKGLGGDGKVRLFLHGLKGGHDFIDTVSLAALYRHLVKARKENWIIGAAVSTTAAA